MAKLGLLHSRETFPRNRRPFAVGMIAYDTIQEFLGLGRLLHFLVCPGRLALGGGAELRVVVSKGHHHERFGGFGKSLGFDVTDSKLKLCPRRDFRRRAMGHLCIGIDRVVPLVLFLKGPCGAIACFFGERALWISLNKRVKAGATLIPLSRRGIGLPQAVEGSVANVSGGTERILIAKREELFYRFR